MTSMGSGQPHHKPMLALVEAEPTVLTVEAIYAAEASFVWRSLRRLGIAQADLPDATQQVFMVVMRRLADFHSDGSIRAWLFGICLRVAADHRKQARTKYEVLTAAPPERSSAAEQQRTVENRQTREQLDRILDQLDEDKRAVFVLYELEEWTMPEVAAAVGCPLQTAYTRYRAARARVEQIAVETWGGDR